MAEDPTPRQLYKQSEQAGLTANFASPGSGVVVYGTGWSINAANIGIHRTYIDLSMLSREQLTLFTQGVDIQNAWLPLVGGNLTSNVRIYDILSTRRLTDEELATQQFVPGFAGSTVDLQEVVFGRRQSLAANGQIPGTFVQVDNATFGSGNPTAMNRLHWTRWVAIISQGVEGTETVVVPPANLVVQAVTAQEKEYVWIERLRRSYVLQEPADV